MTDEHKLTPTERLHDLAMAAITKPAGIVRGAESIELAQVHMGPQAGRWYVKALAPVAQEGETMMELWSRSYSMAQQMQADVTKLNADSLSADLAATLEKGAKS